MPSLRGARVLVAGGGGFLGARVLARLSRAGARTLSLGKELPETPPPGCEALRVRLEREREAEAALRGRAFDYAVHLAAMTRGGPERAADFVLHNLLATANLLGALLAAPERPRRFVLAGTIDEFGAGRAPFGPDSPVRPLGVYAATKAASALLSRTLCRAGGIALTELKFTLLYGPGQRRDMFLPALAEAARAGREFPMTGGRQTRDFLHVDDAARAVVAALRRGGAEDRRYVVASGRAVPVAQAARTLRDMTGGRGTLRMGALPYRRPEMFDGRADPSRTIRELEWRPRVTLEAGLRRLARGER